MERFYNLRQNKNCPAPSIWNTKNSHRKTYRTTHSCGMITEYLKNIMNQNNIDLEERGQGFSGFLNEETSKL